MDELERDCARGLGCGHDLDLIWTSTSGDLLEQYCEANAHDYRGTVAVTTSGRTCQAWTARTPHDASSYISSFPEFNLEGEQNYCRNPDGHSTAWCYTTDPATEWENCDVGSVGTALECADPACTSTGITVTDWGSIDFDAGHGNDQDCRWTLVCSIGHPTIHWNSFNTEAGGDYVNIFVK